MHMKFFMYMCNAVAACRLKLETLTYFRMKLRIILNCNSYTRAAILIRERRLPGPIIVATLRIIANVQGNARGGFGRLDWSSNL